MAHQLVLGDCRRALQAIPARSFDACVTDPPYEIDFMGSKWDRTGAAFDPLTWRGVFRTLKPGAFLLAFGGTRTYHRLAVAIEDQGFEIRDCILWIYGSGMPKGPGQLKPAYEPIVVARRPCEGSARANVKKWGTGGMQVDAARVEAADGGWTKHSGSAGAGFKSGRFFGSMGDGVPTQINGIRSSDLGRWPANVIHDGSDEVLAAFPETRSTPPGKMKPSPSTKNTYGEYAERSLVGHTDSGSAARYFKCCPFTDEERAEQAARFIYCPKATAADRDEGNTHSTVKPTALMRYLCRLATPPGGMILDNFMGSGSTGKAAVLEGFRFTGITDRAEHLAIAESRIAAAANGA